MAYPPITAIIKTGRNPVRVVSDEKMSVFIVVSDVSDGTSVRLTLCVFEIIAPPTMRMAAIAIMLVTTANRSRMVFTCGESRHVVYIARRFIYLLKIF